jgi:hypothetical protein
MLQRLRACRAEDPDRKGTVENAIKHTQGTALKGRKFDSVEAQKTSLVVHGLPAHARILLACGAAAPIAYEAQGLERLSAQPVRTAGSTSYCSRAHRQTSTSPCRSQSSGGPYCFQ